MPDLHHCCIADSWVTFFCYFSWFLYFDVFSQYIFARDWDFVQSEIAVISCRVSYLRSDITYLHSRQRLHRLHVSNWHNKRLNPIIFTFALKLSEYKSMRGIQTQIPRPKFNRIQIIGIIDYKLLFLSVVDRFSHQWPDITSMCNLSLNIRSNNLKFVTFPQIFLLLLFCAHKLNTFDKHSSVDSARYHHQIAQKHEDFLLFSQLNPAIDLLVQHDEVPYRLFYYLRPAFIEQIEIELWRSVCCEHFA